MKQNSNQEKIHFWLKWTILSFTFIPLSYLISLLAVLLVHGAFGFSMEEGGTYLSQTLMQLAGGSIIGLGTGLYQYLLLKNVFDISSKWFWTLILSFAFTELLSCIILWQLQINRYELRWIEFNPLPETLIFACAGLITGFLQWLMLRKSCMRSGYWILSSTLGWGICILITLIQSWAIFAFLLGTLLYGAITGATLMWIIQKKETDS